MGRWSQEYKKMVECFRNWIRDVNSVETSFSDTIATPTTVSSLVTTLSEFKRFPELPAEIRLQIYRLTFRNPAFIVNDPNYSFMPSAYVPIARMICKEAQIETDKYYTSIQLFREGHLTGGWTYFSFERDTMHQRIRNPLVYYRFIEYQVNLNLVMAKIQHLSMNLHDISWSSMENGTVWANINNTCPELKTLTIMVYRGYSIDEILKTDTEDQFVVYDPAKEADLLDGVSKDRLQKLWESFAKQRSEGLWVPKNITIKRRVIEE